MFYIIKQSAQWRDRKVIVEEYQTEKEAVEAASSVPKTQLVAIFKGERLTPVVGEKKITKKVVTGFSKEQQ